jgi:hypothetical protein
MCSFAAWLLSSGGCTFSAHRRMAAVAVYCFAAWFGCELTAFAMPARLFGVPGRALLRAIFAPGFGACRCLCAGV